MHIQPVDIKTTDKPPADQGYDAAVEPTIALYHELRRLANRCFSRQPDCHTLQPTALIHEAFIRLSSMSETGFDDTSHFMATAAKTMRQVLVDHARRRGTTKRGGSWYRIPLAEAPAHMTDPDVDIVALDEALLLLHEFSPRQCEIVEMRFFAGLSVSDVASVLRLSPRTVKLEWRTARAWLMERLR